MNSRTLRPSPHPTPHRRLKRVSLFSRASRSIALIGALSLFTLPAHAQTPTPTPKTAGGTQIQNRASATYSDGSGNNYSTISNTVTVTVSNVSGLVITPDAGTNPNLVAGQTARLTFTVTNTGNFSDQVKFLANGASYRITGSATVLEAFIDRGAPNGNFEAGTDIDIKNNAADVISPGIAQNESLIVAVIVQVNANAAVNDVVTVRLGDATGDSVAADNSANEVSSVTTTPTSVNGRREAVGDLSFRVEDDAQLRLTLTAPAGPVALGSTISYIWELCNPGSRAAQPITLGSTTGVFIVAPIPVGTQLAPSQTFPAGALYTTSPITVAPLSATWTTTAPADLLTVRRVAFPVNGNQPLAMSAGGTATCAAPITMAVVITTTNATTPIFAIGDAFARNDVGNSITDQSGDTVANGGDGNADFEEDDAPANQGTQFDGAQQRTLLQAVGAILLGPINQPGAIGPTTVTTDARYRNDDYTNKSVRDGISGVAPGGVTSAANIVLFTNTVRNDGNANDTIALTVPSVPANFTVEISINGGSTYTVVEPGDGSVSLPIPFGQSRDVLVRVTMPVGQEVLKGYDTVVRASSTNTPTITNDTINRLYTGFLKLDKTATVINDPVRTGAGGASDAVPGADIEFAITYTNISIGDGGSDNLKLTATAIKITEDGNAAPNTWGATTDQVAGSASDTRGGTITGDAAGSVSLTDDVPALGPGQSGVFKFRRRIR